MVIYIVIYFLETSLFLSNICKGFFFMSKSFENLISITGQILHCKRNKRNAMILRNSLVEREVNLEV